MDLTVLELWMTLIGLSMSFSGLPQIYRLIQRKSSYDISLGYFLLILNGQLWWVWYGWTKSSLSIFVTNLVGALGSTIITFLIWLYRSRGRGEIRIK